MKTVVLNMGELAQKIFGISVQLVLQCKVSEETNMYRFEDKDGNDYVVLVDGAGGYRAIQNALTKNEKVFNGHLGDFTVVAA